MSIIRKMWLKREKKSTPLKVAYIVLKENEEQLKALEKSMYRIIEESCDIVKSLDNDALIKHTGQADKLAKYVSLMDEYRATGLTNKLTAHSECLKTMEDLLMAVKEICEGLQDEQQKMRGVEEG